MEPKKFCEPCDLGYNAMNNCMVQDFYPDKGFCPNSYLEGIHVQLDCFNVHIEGKSIPREDKSKLIEIIQQEKIKDNKKCFFVNPFLGEFYNRNV
jgi:hypothetical protein